MKKLALLLALSLLLCALALPVSAEGDIAEGDLPAPAPAPGSFFTGMSFGQVERDGFLLPVPDSENWAVQERTDGDWIYETSSGDDLIYSGAQHTKTSLAMIKDEADALAEYEYYEIKAKNIRNVHTEDLLTPDGWPVRCTTCEVWDGSGDFIGYGLTIWYARDFTLVKYIWSCGVPEGGTQADSIPLTMDDAAFLVSMFGYDESLAPLTVADISITITRKKSVAAVSAGKKAEFSAAFGNPRKVSDKKIVWSLEPDMGNLVRISEKGVLSVSSKLSEPAEVTVRASSPACGTSATTTIHVLPAVTKIFLEPAALTLYAGDSTPQTVQVVLSPDNVPPVGITWKPSRQGVAAVLPGEGGEASVTALAAGKTSIAVSEPGGKTARLSVSVLEPVTGVELSLKGSARPGKTVAVVANISPKKAGNKTVKWSVPH